MHFQSEIRGLLALGGVSRAYNEEYIIKLAAGIHPRVEETVYRHVHKLPPAHLAVVQDGRLQVKKYWELDAEREIRYADPRV